MTGKSKYEETWTYTWDYRNRLTEVVEHAGVHGSTTVDDKFTYDVDGRRIGKYNGSQSWTVYNGDNAYADFNSSGSLTERYLYGQAIDELFARVDSSGNVAWYLTDLLGSVRVITDKSANVLDQITYDSWGNIVSESSPSNGDRFKFTGREWASETGLYYFRARYYNPAIGRFISDDPSAFGAGDANLYRYVDNSPTDATDASGLAAEPGTPPPPKPSTLTPGPFAKESIRARGPGRLKTAEQRQINELGAKYGCHHCGTKDPGTKSGNFVGDHQPPSALNKPKRIYPQCKKDMLRQGGEVRQALRTGPASARPALRPRVGGPRFGPAAAGALAIVLDPSEDMHGNPVKSIPEEAAEMAEKKMGLPPGILQRQVRSPVQNLIDDVSNLVDVWDYFHPPWYHQ